MPTPTPVESYVIKWIADGDEPIGLVDLHPDHWQEAIGLRNTIGSTIEANPDAFLAWVTSVKPAALPDPAHSASGLCEVGPDGVTCIVADGTHRGIYHNGRRI